MEEPTKEFASEATEEVENNSNDELKNIISSEENIEASTVAPQTALQVVEYAGFWVRFVAVLVDGLILIIPTLIVNVIFGKNLGTLVGYLVGWTYAIYMLNDRQATFGKMSVGIKVTKVDGTNQVVGKLALREIVGKILNVITLGIGYLMIAFTEKNQGLHDMLADTVVVYDPTRKRRPWLTVLGIVFALIIPVLGILAGIVLVSTNAARDKAQDTSVEASLSSFMSSAKIYFLENNTYAGFKLNKEAKLIECSGQPIINVSPDGKAISFVAKGCNNGKFFCIPSGMGVVFEVDSSYANHDSVLCSPKGGTN